MFVDRNDLRVELVLGASVEARGTAYHMVCRSDSEELLVDWGEAFPIEAPSPVDVPAGAECKLLASFLMVGRPLIGGERLDVSIFVGDFQLSRSHLVLPSATGYD